MFHDSKQAKYIFVKGEIVDNRKYCWYELEESTGDKPNQKWIGHNSFTGYLTKAEVKFVEVKESSKKTTTKAKLELFFKGQDGVEYIIRSGFETVFAKSVLLKLNSLTREQLKEEITLTVSNASDNEKVVFVQVFCRGEFIKVEWKHELDLDLTLQEIQFKLTPQESEQVDTINEDDDIPF